MAEPKNTTWNEIKAQRGYVSPRELTDAVEARRNDPEFKDRLDRLMDENREVLDRLADS